MSYIWQGLAGNRYLRDLMQELVDIILNAMAESPQLEWFSEKHAKILKHILQEPVFTIEGLKHATGLNQAEIKQVLHDLVELHLLSPRILEALQTLNEAIPVQEDKKLAKIISIHSF